ncbi:hypothetical protein BDR07DRAFT_631237 [Suillus spraguei]|nr:hypothetical protein BDR07DRAFT_631237 [Suillus spraguei]
MTVVSNDPIWWPAISSYRISSYFVVAAFVALLYDWALTFGQEVELVWRQHWSLMTVLYLVVRYLGISYAAVDILRSLPTIFLTDTVSRILFVVWIWTYVVLFAMLWVIIITRLYAMYQRSRKILIFLVVPFLAINIFNGVATMIATLYDSEEEFILSGTYQCSIEYAEDALLLDSIAWILGTVWEALALCLAVWVAVKHFLLMKTHMLYFMGFLAVSCLTLILLLSPTLLTILEVVQMFVLGPRLILGIREYHAKLMADSDAATIMTSIAFQEQVYISSGRGI